MKGEWKLQVRKDPLLLKRAKASLPLMARFNQIRVITTLSMMTAFPIGAAPAMNCSPALWHNDTFPTNFMNTKPNWPTTDDGGMNLPMDMCGFLL
jgi:hypothetical protein